MNAEYLSEDELQYEFAIRNAGSVTDINHARRVLRLSLRREAKGEEIAPRACAEDLIGEFNNCKSKYSTLTRVPVSLRTAQGKKFNTKFLHLLLRLERLNSALKDSSLKDEVVSMIQSIRPYIDSNLLVSGQEDSEPVTAVNIEKELSTKLEDALSIIRSLSLQLDKTPIHKRTSSPNPSPNHSIQSSDVESLSEENIRDVPVGMVPQGRSTALGRIKYRNHKLTNPIHKWNVIFRGDESSSLHDFLSQIKMLSNTERVSDDHLLRSAFYLFDGPARLWFRANFNKFRTWKALVSALKQEFLPEDHDIWLLREIDQRYQEKGESFFLYLAKMELLHQNLVEPISEKSKFKTIMRNLHPSYLEKFSGSKIKSIEHLKIICKNIEDLKYNLEKRKSLTNRESNIKQNNIKFDKSRKIYSVSTNIVEEESNDIVNKSKYTDLENLVSSEINKPDQTMSLTVTPKGQVKCWNCRKEGHTYYQCQLPKTKIFCFNCGKDGFISRICPNCVPSKEKN